MTVSKTKIDRKQEKNETARQKMKESKTKKRRKARQKITESKKKK